MSAERFSPSALPRERALASLSQMESNGTVRKPLPLYRILNSWLGREESNLRMAESKSADSAIHINEYFEKILGIHPSSIKRLAITSKCVCRRNDKMLKRRQVHWHASNSDRVKSGIRQSILSVYGPVGQHRRIARPTDMQGT